MIDLPIKLAVSFLIIGMMVPTLISLTDDVQEKAESTDLQRVCEDIEEHLTGAYFSGNGNMSTMTIDVPAGKRIVIGGQGTDAYILRMFSNGEPVGRHIMDSPWIRVICDETVLEGNVAMTMMSVTDSMGQGVEVTVQ